MKRTATKEDTLKPEFLMGEAFGDFDWNRIIIKVAIGYAYGVVAYIGGINIINMLLLVTNMVWLQYVIAFVALTALLIAVMKTAPIVADALYDAGVYAVSKTKTLFRGAKLKFDTFNYMHSFTKH
jgi:hypothetical protein